ncbi:putative protein phosphatase 2C 78 [Hibiscus syriacus]|uniref:PPM-type phosphatase domain-containing protein n=1 Tax=Hibiscus syriacus TaxID=106335 RepID=A0A6A3BBQ9_HIBSY|nr:putative protein phosphatase 2C 78 [Hibiscus syriacus]
MADICCGVMSEGEEPAPCQPTSRQARSRRITFRRFKFVGFTSSEAENRRKRRNLQANEAACALDQSYPKFGVASACGRRRDMEDAVFIHPSFHCKGQDSTAIGFRLPLFWRLRWPRLLSQELESEDEEWKGAMERSFTRMDREVIKLNKNTDGANCRCELQSPECDAVGSTAVVTVVTPDKIVVSNCGDSRAVCVPDRPDELNRIQEAGGRVICWDGPRVLGVLAMSRAIGDNYLKPYVSSCSVARMCLKGRTQAEGGVGSSMEGGGGIWDKACNDASMLLTKLALARHTTDNVSVVVVDLRTPT